VEKRDEKNGTHSLSTIVAVVVVVKWFQQYCRFISIESSFPAAIAAAISDRHPRISSRTRHPQRRAFQDSIVHSSTFSFFFSSSPGEQSKGLRRFLKVVRYRRNGPIVKNCSSIPSIKSCWWTIRPRRMTNRRAMFRHDAIPPSCLLLPKRWESPMRCLSLYWAQSSLQPCRHLLRKPEKRENCL